MVVDLVKQILRAKSKGFKVEFSEIEDAQEKLVLQIKVVAEREKRTVQSDFMLLNNLALASGDIGVSMIVSTLIENVEHTLKNS